MFRKNLKKNGNISQKKCYKSPYFPKSQLLPTNKQILSKVITKHFLVLP